MIFKQHQLGSWTSVSVLLGVLVDVSSGVTKIQLIPRYPVIGRSVTLSVTGITGTIQSFAWYKAPKADIDYQNSTYFRDENIIGPLYNNSRMTTFPNGSLQISNLNRTDEGNYTVMIQTDTNQKNMTVYLKIYDTVGKPTIKTSTSLPKENITVTLTCTSTNAERIVWSRVPSGATLPSRATLSPDNRTASFSRIKRLDSGDYRCQANNPGSNKYSDPVTITVAYGPENVKVKVKRSPSNSFIVLECSADSVPPATYHWRLNGTNLKKQQSQLRVEKKNEGTYTCVANNTVTRYNAMDSIFVNETFGKYKNHRQPEQNSITKALNYPCHEELTDTNYETSNNGIIFGIGIGIAVVLLLVLVAVLAYFFARHRQHKKKCSTQDEVTMQPISANNEGPVYENVTVPQALPGTQVQATQESLI
ncbi:carcinoembryonic antigen-related cell adhesion molecule 1-like [Rana temporaria]|uniref:carcinoembryonic antigen-related cell adhesion molecule 1-like n=1 Tax=Rana temporaria TaxID=8407 RepID=UPI001AACD513|nr:carcinoembryonic antigen-related cell adhesion molecule 1-like [Rana temporaria]